MNQILFNIRLLISFGFSISSIVNFYEGKRFSGFADLSIAIVITLPALVILFGKKKLTPTTELFKDWHTSKSIDLARFCIGFLMAVASLGAIAQKNNLAAGLLVTALFLLSPLSKMVFGSRSSLPNHLTPAWNIGRLIILFLQSLGVFMFLVAYSMVADPELSKELKTDYSYVAFFVILGIILMFSQQIGNALFKRKSTPLIDQFLAGNLKKEEKNASLPLTLPVTVNLATLKTEYLQLKQMNAQKRGYAFQDFLKKFFDTHQISGRGAFRLAGEEIDGSFELESQVYLLEAKWQEKPCNQSELLIFNGKVEGKSMWARGIFISHAGFTSIGLKAFALGKRTSIIGMDGNDLLLILDGQISLEEAIKLKVRRAAENNEFFVPLDKLLRA
jgi:hypothetical protein